MRDEIQAGLRNAVERGDTLEEAIQSFIGAGYNPVEVKEAAKSVNLSMVPPMQQKKPETNSATKNIMGEQTGSNIMKTFTAPPFSQTGQQNPQPQPVAQNPVNKQTQQAPSPSANPAGQIQPKKSSTLKWIIIIIVLLLLVLGVAGYLLYSNGLLDSLLGRNQVINVGE